MKKKISLICIIALMFSLLVPIQPLSVSAATHENWKVGTKTGGCTIEDGCLVLDGVSQYTYAWNVPQNYTVKATMKADTFKSAMGMQVYNGSGRSTIILGEKKISHYGANASNYSVGIDWHDYRIEVQDGMMSVFADNNLLSTQPLPANTGSPSIKFWCTAGGKFRVASYEIIARDGSKVPFITANYQGDALPGEDYTPAFHDDFTNDTGNWYLPANPAVEWDKEQGVIILDGSKGSAGGYYAVQQAMNFTESFDWKWREKIEKNENKSLQIKFAGDGLNSYFYIDHINGLTGAQWYDGYALTSQAIHLPVKLCENYGDWIDFELQRRGDYLTLFVNGGKVKTWRTYEGNVDPGLLSWAVTGNPADTGIDRRVIDEVTYTPYFPEIEMQKPYNRSEYAQGTDVVLQAAADGETEYIDYFVNDVRVGRGYAPDYKYTLENVNVGTYLIYAAVGDRKSVANTMIVKNAFSAEVVLKNAEVEYNSDAGVSIDVVSLSGENAPVKAEYYVNGRLAATSENAPKFEAALKGLEVGSSTVYAKVTNAQGATLTTESVTQNVYTDGKAAAKINREYDITYSYENGDGSIEVKDGYFGLSLKHSGNKFTYESDEGTEEYDLSRVKSTVTGQGEYRVIVTSGYAEIYYRGQYVTSFYMPRTSESDTVNYSGVESFKMTGRTSKATLFHQDWQGDEVYSSGSIADVVSYSLEFDKTDLSDEVITFYDGRYHLEATFKDGKITVRDQGKPADDIKEEYKIPNDAQIGYYRITVMEGVAQIWCNNRLLGGFVCPLYSSKPHIERKMSNPSASTFVAVKVADDIYYHDEDFSGTKEMLAADYWVKYENKGEFALPTVGGKTAASYTSDETGYAYLNASTLNGSFSGKVWVDKADDFFVVLRAFPAYYNTQMGYDFVKGCWYTENNIIQGNKKGIIKDERLEFPGTFTTGQWHDIEVSYDDRHLVLKCDGKAVIDTSEMWMVQAGCPGFGVTGGTVNFTDVSYVGRSRAGSGMMTFHQSYPHNYPDFILLEDGKTVAGISGSGGSTERYGKVRITEDNGKTWSEIMTQEEFGRSFPSSTIVNLDNPGELVSVNVSNAQVYASTSTDGGYTWSEKVQATTRETPNRIFMNGMFNRGKNGRLMVVTDESLTENVSKTGMAWSDDNGKTWTESNTVLYNRDTGVNFQEPVLMDMPEENHYRIFGRTDRNFVYCADSYDGGHTFGELYPSPFISTCTTYRIRRDLSKDQTYYMLWCYDAENSWPAQRNVPRNRVALAVSHDGMKTWEYIQNVIEIGDYPIGLVRNLSMDIINDTLYISIPGNSNEGVLCTIDTTKMKTTKRFEEAHTRTYFGTVAGYEDYSLSVIPKESGEAWILGNYENVSVQDGRLEAESLAKALMYNISKSGTTVTFKMGEGEVKFTEGSLSVVVNGEEKTFDRAVMVGGHIDIISACTAMGKLITESEKGWVLWTDNVYEDYFKEQIEGYIG